MKVLRKILYPLVIIYFVITSVRNILYDLKFIKSKSFNFPVISIGNLSVGGTGKTPMVEFLIRMLKNNYELAILSRGYGRKSKGFMISNPKSSTNCLGDEPLQIKKKFPSLSVAVDSNRTRGIQTLKDLKPLTQIIILDDAFQHRRINPGISILLTVYNDLYSDDYLLPVGNLREPIFGSKRAQIIIVTKCPEDLGSSEKQIIEKKLNLGKNQKLFFSSIVYDSKIYSNQKTKLLSSLINKNFTLVTGIANSKPLVNHLRALNFKFQHLEFPDHHHFSSNELNLISSEKIILTTEKDFSRLNQVEHESLFYIPIKTKIHLQEKFENEIRIFLENFAF